MRRRWLTSVLSIVIVLAACSSKQAAKDEPSAPPVAGSGDTHTPAAATAPDAAGSAAGDACTAIKARFNAEYARRTGACKTDADCGCYNPVGGKQLGCGGVTDVATTKRLEAIQADFFAASCQFETHCAAWACTPQCQSGRCQ